MAPREPVIDAVLLAGGAARRFGAAKLLASFDEQTVLAASLTRAFAAPARSVRLVLGSRAEAVGAEGRATAERLGYATRLHLVLAEDWAEGMAASLRAGLNALPPDCEAVWLGLADMPRVPLCVDVRLVEAIARGSLAAAPVHGGARGHPVLIQRQLFPKLLALTGDRGARGILDALGPALALVETAEPGVLADIDSPDDLARLGAL